MDVIKTEPEGDPLAIQVNKAVVEDKKPLSEGGNSLDLHVTGIKEEYVHHSSDALAAVEVEEAPMLKREAEEESCDLDFVKEELKPNVTAEDDGFWSGSIAVLRDSIFASESSNVSQECGTVCQIPENSLSLEKSAPDTFVGCSETFTKEDKLKTQSLSSKNSDTSNECNVCGKILATPWSLICHLRTHTGEKPFKCDVCEMSFSISASLSRHRRVHTGEKLFTCDICGLCCTTAGSLKRHNRVHTGEKPFKCDVCGKCFPESWNLRSHSRLHTGEKPFKCDVCGKCFCLSSSLAKHVRVHTGEKPFKCNDCGKNFSHLITVRRHVLQHTGDMPFKCDVCGKSFSQSGRLKNHVRKHHG